MGDRNPRITTERYRKSGESRVRGFAVAVTRDWCVKIDGQFVQAGGRSQRIRTFLTEDAAYRAGVRELAEREGAVKRG